LAGRKKLVPSLQRRKSEMVQPKKYTAPTMKSSVKGTVEIGINYPWTQKYYGWNFGLPPQSYKKETEILGKTVNWIDNLKDDLDEFKKFGISALRWFILADGFLYGVGADCPIEIKKKWKFPVNLGNLPSLNDPNQILEDFEDMLKIVQDKKMKIIPVLIDFTWCWIGNYDKSNPPAGYVKGGRSDVVNDKERMKEFFDKVLKPFLKTSHGYKDTIIAWELINEPEGATKCKKVYKNNPNEIMKVMDYYKAEETTVEQDNMVRFIREGCKIIKDSGFESTVGFRTIAPMIDRSTEQELIKVGFCQDDISKIASVGSAWDYKSLNISLNQFHYYQNSTPMALPHIANLVSIDKPLLGEFATNCKKDTWYDIKNQGTFYRLAHLETKGYRFVFPWSRYANDDHTKKWAAVGNDIQRYKRLMKK
jgi:hypothetical protein